MTDGYHPHVHALRALAVMGPVFLHLWPPGVPDSPLTARVTGLGFLGVELFFVISGFLITGILLRARDALDAGRGTAGGVLRAFYARRALRIFPAYWLLLLAMAAAGMLAVRAYFWWHFTYLTNVVIARQRAWFVSESHFWSLAVEEQFYLAWPLLVLLVPRRQLAAAFAAVVAFAPAWRWYALGELSVFHATVLLPACLDVLGLGALLALAWHDRARGGPDWGAPFVRAAAVAGAVLSAVHLVAYLRSPDDWLTAWPLARTGYALLGVALVDRAAAGFRGPWRVLAELPPVTYLATISYGVYLLHPVVVAIPGFFGVFGGLAGAAPVAFFLVQFAATVALAALSWHVLEKPVNALRRHFPYPR
jgi:peptidoglycan/LPS O-acetylase OafA/YrhL